MQPIYHFVMPSQYWLTSTFLRFQEFYESPRFRNRPFSLEEFQDWYVSTRGHGQFSYHQDWNGFNFPSTVVDAFREHRLDPKSRKEWWALDQLPRWGDRFYVIGTHLGDQGCISHEVVHGLFYLHEEYAKEVQRVVQEYGFSAFKQSLLSLGYCQEVLIDEINAYLTTGLCSALRGKDSQEVRRCRPRLLRCFREHFGFDVSKKEQAEAFARDSIHRLDGSTVVPSGDP